MEKIGSEALAAAREIRHLFPAPVAGGIVLGTGLSEVPERIGAREILPYSRIRGFPAGGSAAGRNGAVWALDRGGVSTILMTGRYHAYEDVTYAAVGMPVQLLAALGAKTVVLTCAAGAVDPRLEPGELVIVSDHMNLSGWNPIQGIPFEARRPRFLDMSRCYDEGLADGIAGLARAAAVPFSRGVLACVPGPVYETPAEVQMLERLGAQAVTMSTVPEAILAHYLELKVGALAVIANRAAGYQEERITHEDVVSVVRSSAAERAGFFSALCGLVAETGRAREGVA